MAIDTESGNIYVGSTSNNISVVSPESNSVIDEVPVGQSYASAMLYEPSTNRLYVAFPGDVSVLDPTSGKVVGTVNITNEESPLEMAFDPTNNELYVLNYPSNLFAVDGTTSALVADIALNSTSPESRGNYGLAWDNDTDTIYAAIDSTIFAISPSSNTVTTTISFNEGVAIATTGGYVSNEILFYDSPGKELYVSSPGANGFEIINASTNTLIGSRLTQGSASDEIMDFALDPTNGEVFAVGQYTVYAYGGTENSLVGQMTVGNSASQAIFDPANGYLYVESGSETIAVIDPDLNRVVGALVGEWGEEQTYAFEPFFFYQPFLLDAANGNLFVSTGENITVISPGSVDPTVTIPTNDSPEHMAYDSANDELYVAITGGYESSVEVINASTNSPLKYIGDCSTGPNPPPEQMCSPSVIAYDPANGRVYVAANDPTTGQPIVGLDDVLYAIDGGTNTISSEILLAGVRGPVTNIVADPSSGELVVTVGGSVLFVNAATNSVLATLGTGTGMQVTGLVFDSQTSDAYAISAGAGECYPGSPEYEVGGRLTVFDVAMNSAVTNMTLGGDPTSITDDSSNGDLYIADSCLSSNLIQVTPGADNVSVANLTCAHCELQDLTYDSFNQDIYATGSEGIVVLNSTGVPTTIYGFVASENQPPVVDPADGHVFVTGYADDSVSVIGGAASAVLANVRAGINPKFIVFDPVNGNAYISVSASNIVYVLPDSVVSGSKADVSVSCASSLLPANSTTNCTASVTGIDPSGSIDWASPFTVSPNPCEVVNGSCRVALYAPVTEWGSEANLTALYSGDSNNLPWSAYALVTISNSTVASATYVTCALNPDYVNQTTYCTATVTGYYPSGNVTWTSNGQGTFRMSDCTLSSVDSSSALPESSCFVYYTPTEVGVSILAASYGADFPNNASSGTLSLNVAATSSSTTTAGSMATSSVTATTSNSSTGSSSTTNTSRGIPEFPIEPISITVFTVVITISYLILARRRPWCVVCLGRCEARANR